MWSQEDLPTGNIPWQLRIRARYVHEVDAVLGSVIVQTLQGVASREVTVAVSLAANAAVFGRHDEKVDAEHALSAMRRFRLRISGHDSATRRTGRRRRLTS